MACVKPCARSAVAVALALLAGCTTIRSPSGPVREEAHPGGEAAPGSLLVEHSQSTTSRQVRFDTRPQGAQLLLDNRLRGTTPLLFESLAAGRYKVEARKAGYRPLIVWIAHSGAGARYTLSLAPLTGFLHLSVSPPEALVMLGDSQIAPGVAELPVGRYTLRASAFGYQAEQRSVLVEADATTDVSIQLAEAPFSARWIAPVDAPFDPDAPGTAGRRAFRFELTGPASGTFRVSDANGAEVYAADVDARAPRGELIWSGRTPEGMRLPDGPYIAELALHSARGEEARLVSRFFIARLPQAPGGSQWSLLRGLLYAPEAEAAPAGSGGLALAGAVFATPGDDPLADEAAVSLGAYHGIGGGFEIDAVAATRLVSEPPVPFLIGIAAKRSLLAAETGEGLAAACTARLTVQAGSGDDPFTAFTALGLGFATGLRTGPWLVTLAPELALSPWRITGDSTYDDEPSLGAWIYLRAGLSVRLGSLAAGVSAALRTVPLAEGLSAAAPVAVGFEAHWGVPPDGRLEPSMWVSAEIDEGGVSRLLLGSGFCYRY